MDSEKLKAEIDDRLGFLSNKGESAFKDGYELALKQFKAWIIHEELLIEAIKYGLTNQK